jgi:hypothetical protein
MEEGADDVADGEAEKPENQKNNKDSPEHIISFGLVSSASFAGPQVRLKNFSIPQIFGYPGGLCINSNKLLAAHF